LSPCGQTEEERRNEILLLNAASEAERLEIERQLEEQRRQQNAASIQLIGTVCKKCPSCSAAIQVIILGV